MKRLVESAPQKIHDMSDFADKNMVKKTSRKNIMKLLWNGCFGILLGIFTGAVAVITHSAPLEMEWIGFFLASVLVLVGGWIVVESAGKFGALGYFLGVTVTTVILLFFPLADDIIALQTQTISRIWIFVAVILSFVPLATVFRKKSS